MEICNLFFPDRKTEKSVYYPVLTFCKNAPGILREGFDEERHTCHLESHPLRLLVNPDILSTVKQGPNRNPVLTVDPQPVSSRSGL